MSWHVEGCQIWGRWDYSSSIRHIYYSTQASKQLNVISHITAILECPMIYFVSKFVFPCLFIAIARYQTNLDLRNVICSYLYFKISNFIIIFIIIFVKSYICEVLVVSPSWISLAFCNKYSCVKSLSITEVGSLSVERYEVYIGINSMMFTAKKMNISIKILIFLFMRLCLKQQNRLLK